eukprot:Hpha_TRINITY_DN16497_c1_g1::TRINITY_DN16497_c1_g1_i1::g.161107::m.161107/K01581/E4.1.1.17, ODC1, speC, speF; ornithine decarboxylase
MVRAACQWARPDAAEAVEKVAKSFQAVSVKAAECGQLSDSELEQVFKGRIERAVGTETEGDSFYVVDIGAVEAQMAQWQRYLPRVRPFYAWKCNGNPALVATLAAMGAGFDCASRSEFEEACRLPGLVPERDIIFANPCKQVSHCRSASARGVQMVTYDNAAELPKIARHWPEAKALLRIVTDDSKSICELSSKYGAALDRCSDLISKAIAEGVEVVGVSFHVGSGCGDVDAFVKAAKDARQVFDMAAEQGLRLSILDIGGGFPGDAETTPSFKDIAQHLSPFLDQLFPEDVEIIAEPGRYFACSSHSLAANVFSKREIDIPRGEQEGSTDGSASEEEDEREVQYYVNEGLYQSFNCVFYDHALVNPQPLRMRPCPKGKGVSDTRLTTIFGPTCDGLDCIAKRIDFPELDVEDWIYFRDFGAYTVAGASGFNGFDLPNFHYVRSFSG